MYVCREMSGVTHQVIARRFAVGSATTVSAACVQVRASLARDSNLQKQWTRIRDRLITHYRQPATP